MNQKNKSSCLQVHSKKNLNKFDSSDEYIFREINIFAKESFPSDKEIWKPVWISKIKWLKIGTCSGVILYIAFVEQKLIHSSIFLSRKKFSKLKISRLWIHVQWQGCCMLCPLSNSWDTHILWYLSYESL